MSKRQAYEWHTLIDRLAGLCDLAGLTDLADRLDIAWDANGTAWTGTNLAGERLEWLPPRFVALEDGLERLIGQWSISDAWTRRHLRVEVRKVAGQQLSEGLSGAATRAAGDQPESLFGV